MKFIALTKSDKHGGYCVAGLDENGNKIRLVSTEKGGALDDECFSYAVPTMLEVEAEPVPLKNQPENYLLKSIARELPLDFEKLKPKIFTDNKKYGKLFVNTKEYLTEWSIYKTKWSLAFIEVSDLSLSRNSNGHYKAKFTYNGDKYKNVSVTDPKYESAGDIGKAYLVVSLPNNPYFWDKRFYKFIAAIYPK